MEKLTFKIMIDAPREKVWEVLWQDDTYRDWTSVFSPGSQVETDWNEGSKILFLDGKGSGMVSRIAAKKAPEYMSFEHLGEVQDGIEDLSSERVSAWAGAKENYTLTEQKGKTEVLVETDITHDFKDFMLKAWPKALEKLKSIAEGTTANAQVY